MRTDHCRRVRQDVRVAPRAVALVEFGGRRLQLHINGRRRRPPVGSADRGQRFGDLSQVSGIGDRVTDPRIRELLPVCRVVLPHPPGDVRRSRPSYFQSGGVLERPIELFECGRVRGARHLGPAGQLCQLAIEAGEAVLAALPQNLPRGEGLAWQVADRDAPHYVQDYARLAGASRPVAQAGADALAWVPLGSFCGAQYVAAYAMVGAGRVWSARQRKLLEASAGIVRQAMWNRHQRDVPTPVH